MQQGKASQHAKGKSAKAAALEAPQAPARSVATTDASSSASGPASTDNGLAPDAASSAAPEAQVAAAAEDAWGGSSQCDTAPVCCRRRASLPGLSRCRVRGTPRPPRDQRFRLRDGKRIGGAQQALVGPQHLDKTDRAAFAGSS
ncbi:hypothetical protein [Solimonas soli]|uniref:hypothetical protein n=1 Tax=Solimonas soli TaxID=413479 RepID=UPI00146F9CCD